jgi:hypothetical protein
MSKESKEKIKMMRNLIIQQIKETDWRKTVCGFKNDIFEIRENIDNDLIIEFGGSECYLNEFIGYIHFHILYYIYILPSLRRYEKNRNDEVVARSIDFFFTKNKDIYRDNKIDEILK